MTLESRARIQGGHIKKGAPTRKRLDNARFLILNFKNNISCWTFMKNTGAKIVEFGSSREHGDGIESKFTKFIPEVGGATVYHPSALNCPPILLRNTYMHTFLGHWRRGKKFWTKYTVLARAFL
jgi:hypothetical protein